jgi:hypothetical protein
MRRVATVLSSLALAATVAVPCLYFAGAIEHEQLARWLFAATVVWFCATPVWMERRARG